MGPLDAAWHLLNFIAPAFGVGALTAWLAKLVWWRDLRAVPWWRLAVWAGTGAAIGLVAALVAFGRDGSMAGYALMLLTGSAGLWWRAWSS